MIYNVVLVSGVQQSESVTRNGRIVTDVENKLMGVRGGRDKLGDWDGHIHTTIYKIDN